MDLTIPAFISGVQNLIDPENINKDAAQDEQNFVTQDGKVVLVPGRELLGAQGTVGGTTGFHKAYKVDGSSVLFCKRGTAIQYYNGSTWVNCITGLNFTDQYTFANYSSLAGAFVYVNGPGGLWKIVTAVPGSPLDMYDSAKNYKAYMLIDRGRSVLWNRDKDKTGLYLSWIDRQNATVYTTVAGEAIGALGSTVYSGTLAFVAARRSCFGVTITGLTGSGQETFTDNYLGVLTSNLGGTGTINYVTGAYSVTFAHITTGAVTADYQWENSSVKGVVDFSHSAVRLAGEGAQFPQDEGGDAILKVEVGQDGAYYSLKSKSCYMLSIDADDLGATNEVYRKEMGLPFFRASISTNRGIFFVNTNNPTKPEVTVLEKSAVSLTVLPKTLFKHFKFSNYVYDQCFIGSYDRWMVILCRTADSTTNNRMLLCDIDKNTVDIIAYSGNMCIQDGYNFYVADSVTTGVYSTFSGFDDLGNPVDSYWIGRDEMMGTDQLKKNRKMRFKGKIGVNQSVGIYTSLDEQGFQKVGSIVGSASYVNQADSQAIGSNYIGETQIGGITVSSALPYYMEIKTLTDKYRKITVKLIPEGIGYFDFDTITFWDILLYENRLPKAFRQKQNVSLDGLNTNQ